MRSIQAFELRDLVIPGAHDRGEDERWAIPSSFPE
jgi:hypothetical protein